MTSRRNWLRSGAGAVLFALLLLLPLQVLAILASADPQEPIPVAAVFADTGLAAKSSAHIIKTIERAVDSVNASGGVLGRPLELMVFDNGSSFIGSRMAARMAVEQGAVAVIGSLWSSHSLAIADVLQEAGVPMITPTSTDPDVTREKSYIFRTCFIDSLQGHAAGRFAAIDLGAETAAVIRNIDEQYSMTLAGFFQKAYRQFGGKVVYAGEYRGTATDFSGVIGELAKLQPDLIYLPGYARDVGLFIKQARRLGVRSLFLGGDGWGDPTDYAGAALEGSYKTAHWHPDCPCEGNRAFLEMWRKIYQERTPSLACPLAYDAVLLLADAIERAGSVNRADIRAALASTCCFAGVAGELTMDVNGDPLRKRIVIVTYRNRDWSVAKIITPP